MTCENCVHYEVCAFSDKTMKWSIKKDCNHYKSKSLFVELPCAVGDVVHKNYDSESVHRRTIELKVFKIEITEKAIMISVKATTKYIYNYDCLRIEDFGKTVFLTEEQAKEKLKEMG